MRKHLKNYGYKKFNKLPFQTRERLRTAGRMDLKFLVATLGLVAAVALTMRVLA